MKILAIIFTVIGLTSCGALGGAMGAMKVQREIEEKVCPKYPMDPNCTQNRNKKIVLNGKHCTTYKEWNKELETHMRACRPPSAAPGTTATISKAEHQKNLSAKMKTFCEARLSIPSGDVSEYRAAWHETLASVLREEGKVFEDSHRCKSGDLRASI